MHECVCVQIKRVAWLTAAPSLLLTQLRRFTTPHSTSETTRRLPSSESSTGRNITLTYTWGTQTCRAVWDCSISFPAFWCNLCFFFIWEIWLPLSSWQEDPSGVDPWGRGRVRCLAPQALPGEGESVKSGNSAMDSAFPLRELFSRAGKIPRGPQQHIFS